MSTKEDNSVGDLDGDTLQVAVVRGRNFRGNKGDFLGNIVIKANYCEKTLGESIKYDCSNKADTDFHFHFSLSCPSDDLSFIDEMTYKPLVITFFRFVPKDKKKKEDEKIFTIGICTVDLLPIVRGETCLDLTLELAAAPSSILETFPPEVVKPEVDISLAIGNSLIDREELAGCNILRINFESLNSPPETMYSPNHVMVTAISIPLTNEKENPVVFVGNNLRTINEKEQFSKQKKWVNALPALGAAALMPNCFISSDSKDNEDGDFRSKEDKEFRRFADLERPKFVWNMERRCFLHHSAVKQLLETITTKRYLSMEVFRMAISSGGKGKKHEDEGVISFPGVVQIDASPLLYPGVKQIKGAYKVQSISDADLLQKASSSVGLIDEAVKFAWNYASQCMPSSSARKIKDDKKDPRKTAKLIPDTSEVDLHTLNADGMLYLESRSHVVLSMTLDQPLIAKKTPIELSQMVESYIPPRPEFPKRLGGANRAISEFHKQIGCVATQLMQEFRKQRLLFHLNTSGKYFTYKERLKHSVVKIVREKYLRTTDFEDKEKLQDFLTELHAFLVDEMNTALNRFLTIEDQPFLPDTIIDSIQLKQFADEAEMNGNMTLAAKYYEERIIKEKSNPNHWIDYAIFCLGCLDFDKAEQCARECISIDQKHHDGLILIGVLSCIKNLYDISETFFEAALSIYPESILALTLLGICYDSASNEMRAEMAFHEAQRLNIAQHLAEIHKKKMETIVSDPVSQESTAHEKEEFVEDYCPEIERKSSIMRLDTKSKNETSNPSTIEEADTLNEPDPEFSIYMIAAEWLIKYKIFSFAERPLAHELLQSTSKPSIQYFWCLAQICIAKKEFDEAEKYLKEALLISQAYPDTWALLGHVKYLTGFVTEAQSHYERTLAFVNDAKDTHPVYLRLGSIYLQNKLFTEAREIFLLACKSSPSSVTWLGVAIACYRMDMLHEAESALSEANILNNMDPEIWAYLTLVCLKCGRIYEAEQSFKFSIKLGLDDKEILDEIFSLQDSTGIGNMTFHTKENIVMKGN
ncbi:cilia- and flagella-associated protein 70-like [Argonauta hians]